PLVADAMPRLLFHGIRPFDLARGNRRRSAAEPQRARASRGSPSMKSIRAFDARRPTTPPPRQAQTARSRFVMSIRRFFEMRRRTAGQDRRPRSKTRLALE